MNFVYSDWCVNKSPVLIGYQRYATKFHYKFGNEGHATIHPIS